MLGYRLNGVAALSAASAWAVGLSNQGTIHPIRWDGRTWQRVPASGGGDLYALAVLSAADAWAVGYGPSNEALIEHWNGTAWTPVAAPSTGGPAILHAVAAVSPGDVWAVGGANTAGPAGGGGIFNLCGTLNGAVAGAGGNVFNDKPDNIVSACA